MLTSEFLNNFDFDKDVGEAKACEALNRIQDKNVEARTVMRLILAIAASDGVFDQDEKIVAIKIAKELGLNPADFEL